MERIIKFIIKWNGCLTILFLSICILSCHPIKKKNRIVEHKESDLSAYYRKNNWQFPIEVDTGIQYVKNVGKYKLLVLSDLRQKIYKWCISDSLLSRYSNYQSIRISEFRLTPIRNEKFKITCNVDFYKKGVPSEGLVLPVERHAIVENKFLMYREIAIFILEHDTLTFSKWF